MNTQQIKPSNQASVASVTLKVLALIARVTSYTPYILFIIFSTVQALMCLALLVDDGVSVSGVIFLILMLLLRAPLLITGGSLDMTTSMATSDIAISIGFWLIVITVCDLLIRKRRHKRLIDTTPQKWLHRKTLLIYTAIYLVSTTIMLISQPDMGETLVVQILFYVFGLICYIIYRSINLLARAIFVKSQQLVQTGTTSKP
ncbi:MAG: hypothetical protein ABIQ64_01820 [Candidatus Saccharimonadales bacterium]